MTNNNNLLFAWNPINEALLHDERGDRIFHERLYPFKMPDRQFVKLFRLNKQTNKLVNVMNLICSTGISIRCNNEGNFF